MTTNNKKTALKGCLNSVQYVAKRSVGEKAYPKFSYLCAIKSYKKVMAKETTNTLPYKVADITLSDFGRK